MGRCIDEWVDVYKNEWVDALMSGLMYIRKNEWMDA